jgi:hypothetical protein
MVIIGLLGVEQVVFTILQMELLVMVEKVVEVLLLLM